MHHRPSRFPIRADSRLLALLSAVGAALVALLYGDDDVDAAAGIVRGYR